MFKKIIGAFSKGSDKGEPATVPSQAAETRLRAIKDRAVEIPAPPAEPKRKDPPEVEALIAKVARDSEALKEAAIISGVLRAEEERPLSAAAFAAKEVSHHVLAVLKNERGVHAETAFAVLGALAGYACQAAVRAQHAATGSSTPLPLNDALVADGRHFFFGDALNRPLAETKLSVWSLAAGAAQQAGCKALPDISEIFGHVSKNLGSSQFGVPRVPDQHRPGVTIDQTLKALWPKLQPLVQKVCLDPMHWPIAYSLAIQDLFQSTKGVLDPGIALAIVMETAVPSSKIDLSGPS